MKKYPFVYDESSPSCLRWAIYAITVAPGDAAGTLHWKGYWQVGIQGKIYQTHRVIWEMHNGPIPEGIFIDHINGIKSDNRIANLRLATGSQNQQNKTINSSNKCGLKGVSKIVGGWRATIKINGKQVHLGSFASKYLAYSAYCDKAIEAHGEFARLS